VELSPWAEEVLAVVDSIEPGSVMTYGEVAAEAGKPGAARAVGGILRRHGAGHSWWRVVAANGRLVPGGEDRHRSKLRSEGLTISGNRVVGMGRVRRPDRPA
jgi:methylated-DNA-protein-cysteine methyltransferase-like protein